MPLQSHSWLSAVITAAFLLAPLATTWSASSEAVEVSGGVVGLVKVTLPGGHSRALSLPVTQPAVFSGVVSAVDGRSIRLEGANWSASSFGPYESRPHVARCVGGTADGATFRIKSHTADSLVLDIESLMPSVGDHIEILPADTLAGLFGGPEDGILTASNPESADNVMVHDGEAWLTYFHDGTTWRLAGDSEGDHSLAALPPDRGIFFVRRGKSVLRLTVAGELAPTANAIVAEAGTTTFLANPFAATIRLQKLGLHNDPAWHSAPSADNADLVHIYQGRAWKTYFHDGRNWRTSIGRRVANPLVLRGSALVAERRSGQILANQPEPPYPLQ